MADDELETGLNEALDRLEADYKAQIDEIDRGLTYHLARALIGWAIRWTIGFGLIWAITAWTGRYEWLWTVGIVVAGAFLILVLGFRIWMHVQSKRGRRLLDKIAESRSDKGR